MESKIAKSKIKSVIIGTGEWGKQISDATEIVNRYDLIGKINTSTPRHEKDLLLREADLIYVAVPQSSQMDYLKLGLELGKHIICESPMCENIYQRKELHDILLTKSGQRKIFYCNFPYFLDQDFARLVSRGIVKKAKFFSFKCLGPKFSDEPELAKKFYINQVLNLIFNTATFLNTRGFDRLVIRDDFSGEFYVNDITYSFRWGYNEYPKLDLEIKGEDSAVSSEIIYDGYDQIYPLLLNFSNRILNLDEAVSLDHFKKAEENGDDLIHRLSLSSYLTACSAEYFSDVFCQARGRYIEIIDASKLFLNGGLQDLNYSIINKNE